MTNHGSQTAVRQSLGLALAALVLLLGASPMASAAVATDGAATTGSANSTTVTFSHTVGSGSNRLLIVAVTVKGNHAVDSVTYGGVAMTRAFWQLDTDIVEIWRLLAPATGAANVVVTLSGSANFAAGALSFTGVDQAAPLGAIVGATATSTTPSVTVHSRTGDLVLDVLAEEDTGSGSTDPAAGGSQTGQWSVKQGLYGAASTQSGAASVTSSWTLVHSKAWTDVAVNIRRVGMADGSVVTGQYTGNATDDTAITAQLGFEPAVVFIKGDTAQERVVRTATMDGDLSKPMVTATALTANLIQSLEGIVGLSQGGFTIGTDARVNSNTLTYYWDAFSAKAGQMFVGSYVGNNTDNTSITGVGFQPDVVMIFSDTNQIAVWRTSTLAGDKTMEFTGTAAAANLIQAMESDGFQLGNDAQVNSSGIQYHYVAWKQTAGVVKVGSYAGDSTDNRNITGVGFQPELVLVRSDTTVMTSRFKSGATGASTDMACYSTTSACANDTIQALQSDGFQVGASFINVTGNTYNYVAWGRSQINTAVTLASFTVSRTDSGVLLKWRTGYEVDNLGFHVYREERGIRTRITPRLVGGGGLIVKPGVATTAALSYQWIDKDAPARGTDVTYWLEDVDLNGTKTLHGPIAPASAVPKLPTAVPSSP